MSKKIKRNSTRRPNNQDKFNKVIDRLLEELSEAEPWVYHKALTGSAYIKFHTIHTSLRIADHDGIEKYNYRWNLRMDINRGSPYSLLDEHMRWRHYYPYSCLRQLVADILSVSAGGEEPCYAEEIVVDIQPERPIAGPSLVHSTSAGALRSDTGVVYPRRIR